MKKYMMFFVMFFVLASFGIYAADNSMKVPADLGVRIRNVQLDISRTQTQMLQMANQYQQFQTQLNHDQGELDSLKKEAITAAKLDNDKYDLDVEKLEFVSKPAKEAKPAEKK